MCNVVASSRQLLVVEHPRLRCEVHTRRVRGSGRVAVLAVVLEVVGVDGERRAQPVQVPAGALDVVVEEYLHRISLVKS